jgi:hypothetical protein
LARFADTLEADFSAALAKERAMRSRHLFGHPRDDALSPFVKNAPWEGSMAPKRQVYSGPEKGDKPAGYMGPYHQGHPTGQRAADEETTGYLSDPELWRAGDCLPTTTHTWEQGGRDLPQPDHSDGLPAHDFSDGKPIKSYSER